MIDMKFLYGAIALMLIFIVRDYLKKYHNFNMDKVNIGRLYKVFLKAYRSGLKKPYVIKRNTGTRSLLIKDCGDNKVTVMATLRQITGISYNEAKSIVNSVPTKFMINISDNEADLNKKALEFVGAKVDII